MASISTATPKPLASLDLLRHTPKQPPPPPPPPPFSLAPIPSNPLSSTFPSLLLLRLPPPQPLLRGLPTRFRASVVAQDSSGIPPAEGEGEEEEDELGARGGFDWGQQEEVSDGEVLAEEEAEAAGGDEEGFPLPPEDAKLFVGNLPFDIDSSRLAGLFQQAGVVEIAEVIYNRDTSQSRGFGFVTMSTVEEAEQATEMFNGFDFDGRRLRVNKAAPRGSPPRPNRRIFVGNIPFQVDGVRLEEVFSECGKVIEARVVYEKDTGRSRGFGFVRMSTDQETDNAIASLDGKDLDGRNIRLSVAEERPRFSP